MVPFDWYYFDISSPDGSDFVITFHVRPFTTEFKISIVDLFLYQHGSLEWHYYFPLSLNNLQVSEQKLFWDENNFIAFNPNDVQFHVKDKQITVEARFFEPIVQNQIIEMNLLPDSNNNKHFNWQLRIPKTRADANISFKNQSYKIQGYGYHDRNYGNVFLGKEIQGWRWGKYYFSNRMLVLGEILDWEGKKRTIVIENNDKNGNPNIEHAGVEWGSSAIKIQLPSGNVHLEKMSSIYLDEIYFYAPAKWQRFPIIHKLRELIGFYSQSVNASLLVKWNANARYRRLQETYLHNGKPVRAFVEEMTFYG